MNKKNIILFAILSSSFFGIFGCIDCGEHFSFQEITNVTGTLVSNDFEEIEVKTDLDSLFVFVNFDINFIANNFTLPFINQAYAWSCDRNGDLGLKDKIVDLKLYSTVDYLGFPSGSEIELKNSLELPKTELIELLNENLIGFRFLLEEKQIGHMDLYASFEAESGSIQEYELVNFEWE